MVKNFLLKLNDLIKLGSYCAGFHCVKDLQNKDSKYMPQAGLTYINFAISDLALGW